MSIKKLFSVAVSFVLLTAMLNISVVAEESATLSAVEFSNKLELFFEENSKYDIITQSDENDDIEIVANRLIVGTNSNKALTNDYGAIDCLEGYNNWHILQYLCVDDAKRAYVEFFNDSSVEFVEYDAIITKEEIADDVETIVLQDNALLSNRHWESSVIESDNAKELLNSCTITQNEIVVAVIDTGVEETHSIFKDSNNNSRVLPGNRQMDNTVPNNDGHGTNVAGVVAANTNENIKIKSYNYFYYLDSKVPATSLATEICAAVEGDENGENGADVINMSIYKSGSLPTIVNNAIMSAVESGVVVVSCAGNEGDDASLFWPANALEGITVSAVNSNFNYWKNPNTGKESNYGSIVDIAAPGDKIYTATLNDNFISLSGTSVAAPIVAAAAAMIKSIDPDKTPAEIEELIKSTAFVPDGWDTNYGVGIVNYMNILEKMRTETPKISHSNKSATITALSPDAEIYYTTDGSDPVVGVSPLYTEPISTNGVDLIKAIAYEEGSLPSTVKSFIVNKTYNETIRYKGTFEIPEADQDDFLACYVSNEDIITYEDDGTVKAHKVGKTTATVYLKGGKTVTYKFTVEYAWWQQIIRIFLLGFLWY